jgi:hypothetical protein
MIIFEFLILSISTWVVFKTADHLFEKAKNFDFKGFFDKQQKTKLFLHNFYSFTGSLPAIYYVNFHLVPSVLSVKTDYPMPLILIIYWVSIFHLSCFILYYNGFCIEDYPINCQSFLYKFLMALVCSLFSILFCFTAGFVVVPLLAVMTVGDILNRLGFRQ